MEERFLSEAKVRKEIEHESRLRPKDFSEYVGQKKVVANIDLMVSSANIRAAFLVRRLKRRGISQLF